MTDKMYKQAAALAAGAALIFSLSACGGSTADSSKDSSSSTVATMSDGSGSSGSSEPSKSSDKSKSSDPSKSDGPVDENGAEEVDKAPNQSIPRSDDDNKYLKLLKDGGIDVDGEIGDQLIGTGHEVCLAKQENRQEYVTPAVGGQLVAQQKTKLDGDAAGKLIADSAKKVYC